MEHAVPGEHILELVWRQVSPGQSIAVLTDGETGEKFEVHSRRELRTVLKRLLTGGMATPIAAPQAGMAGSPGAVEDGSPTR
jgi:hypothetical protein